LRRNRHPDRTGGIPRLASDRGHWYASRGPPAHASSAVVSRSSCGLSPRLFVSHPIVFGRREAAEPLDLLRSRFRRRVMSSMRESPHSGRPFSSMSGNHEISGTASVDLTAFLTDRRSLRGRRARARTDREV
jgi:hypothetical protein